MQDCGSQASTDGFLISRLGWGLGRWPQVGTNLAKGMSMKSNDAPGFFVMGTLMTFLPALLPAYFPPTGLDGANTSALWLEVMGVVNNLVGTVLIAGSIPAAVARMLAWRMPLRVEARPVMPVPARLLRPAALVQSAPDLIYRGLTAKTERRLAA